MNIFGYFSQQARQERAQVRKQFDIAVAAVVEGREADAVAHWEATGILPANNQMGFDKEYSTGLVEKALEKGIPLLVRKGETPTEARTHVLDSITNSKKVYNLEAGQKSFVFE